MLTTTRAPPPRRAHSTPPAQERGALAPQLPPSSSSRRRPARRPRCARTKRVPMGQIVDHGNGPTAPSAVYYFRTQNPQRHGRGHVSVGWCRHQGGGVPAGSKHAHAPPAVTTRLQPTAAEAKDTKLFNCRVWSTRRWSGAARSTLCVRRATVAEQLRTGHDYKLVQKVCDYNKKLPPQRHPTLLPTGASQAGAPVELCSESVAPTRRCEDQNLSNAHWNGAREPPSSN
ncbi:unnamed protein product [Lota lota]